MIAGLKGLLSHGLELLQVRLELFLTELEEEKSRLLRQVALGATAILLLSAGAVFLAIFLTVLLWDWNRLLVLAVFSTLFLGAGTAALVLATRRRPAGADKPFAASLAELAEDRASLGATAGHKGSDGQ